MKSTPPTRDEVRTALIKALAEIEGAAPADVEADISARGGDNMYELDSKAAECIIGPLMEEFKCRLPGPADLQPDEYSTVESLTDLVYGQLKQDGA